jgi:hypothetical protein
MPFFPPDQLPPMQDSPDAAVPITVTRRRTGIFIVAATLIGIAVAVVLYWRFSTAFAFLAIPVSMAIGWYLAANPTVRVLGKSSEGPVLW